MGPQEPQVPQVPQEPAPQPQQPMQMQTPQPVQPQFQQPTAPQPSTFGQPPQPMMTPQPTMFGSAPQPVMGMPAPKKGLGKGALFGIIGGAVGLVLLIIGLILALTIFGGPSKDDFRKAGDKLNEATTSYNTMTSLQYISTYSATETTVKNDLQKIKDVKAKVNATVDELGKMKAVNDSDVKDAYNKLKDKMAAFDKTMDAGSEVYEKIMPVMIKLTKATSSYASSNDLLASLTDIRKSLEGLDLKTDINKTYATGLVAQIKILEDVLPKKIAMSTDYTKYDSAVSQKYYDAIDELSNLDDDWQSNLDKISNEGEIKDQLNNLGTLLYDKYLGIKK